MLHVAIAPTGFKECLDADAVARHMAEGVHRSAPGATVDRMPLVDGGEGSARILARSLGGELVEAVVAGPAGRQVRARYALLGPDRRTAFVEAAAAAGLRLLEPAERRPGDTTTRGVGELIAAALDRGARRILVGCGDSGTCDGGAGALRALGAQVLDERGRALPEGGAALAGAHQLDLSGLHRALAGADVVVATNPVNLLCGRRGVARVFGPQKGADPQQVELLDRAVRTWGEVLARHAGRDLSLAPGGGASGGLGAGLAAVGARLASRFDVFLDGAFPSDGAFPTGDAAPGWDIAPAGDLDQRLRAADVVLTGEGSIDATTAGGKIPAEVARRAKRFGKPVLALCGTIGSDAEVPGIDVISGILRGPADLEHAMRSAPELITDATARSVRMLLLGRGLPAAAHRPSAAAHRPSA